MNPTRPHLTQTGIPAPLGATVLAAGVNFAVFSKYAEAVQLLLFGGPEDPTPSRVIDLDPRVNRTSYYWHVFVPLVGPGQTYAWRARGPSRPEKGHRFDGEKVLLDPYGLAVVGQNIYDRQAARIPGDNAARSLRSVVVDTAAYDWEDDRPLPPPAGEKSSTKCMSGPLPPTGPAGWPTISAEPMPDWSRRSVTSRNSG